MARINVEQKALTDPRFYRLGLDMGADPKAAHAVGLVAMIRVWNECIERGRYALDGWLLDATLGVENIGETLVKSDLATRSANGQFRLRGTKGRVEYLEEKRKLARKNGCLGGRPRKPASVSGKTDVGVPEKTLIAPAPAPVILSSTPAKPAREKKPRERNPVFDALAEVTGTDVTIKSNCKTIGTKSAELSSAEPPYSPDEIRAFGTRFHELCDWARRDGRPRPTPGELVKWIHLLRLKPPASTSNNGRDFDPMKSSAPIDFDAERNGR